MSGSPNTRPWYVIVAWCAVVAGVAFGVTVGLRNGYNAWVVHCLLNDLHSEGHVVREHAVEELRNRRVDFKSHLINLLNHENEEVRSFAAWELRDEVPVSDDVVRAFLKVVSNEEDTSDAPFCAMLTLQRYAKQLHGEQTTLELEVIDVMRGRLHQEVSLDAGMAAWTLHDFGPRAKSAEADLLSAMEKQSGVDRVHMAGALQAICPEHRAELLPVFLDALEERDTEGYSHSLVITYIGEMGPAAESAVPFLEDAECRDPLLAYYVNESIKLIRAREDVSADAE